MDRNLQTGRAGNFFRTFHNERAKTRDQDVAQYRETE